MRYYFFIISLFIVTNLHSQVLLTGIVLSEDSIPLSDFSIKDVRNPNQPAVYSKTHGQFILPSNLRAGSEIKLLITNQSGDKTLKSSIYEEYVISNDLFIEIVIPKNNMFTLSGKISACDKPVNNARIYSPDLLNYGQTHSDANGIFYYSIIKSAVNGLDSISFEIIPNKFFAKQVIKVAIDNRRMISIDIDFPVNKYTLDTLTSLRQQIVDSIFVDSVAINTKTQIKNVYELFFDFSLICHCLENRFAQDAVYEELELINDLYSKLQLKVGHFIANRNMDEFNNFIELKKKFYSFAGKISNNQYYDPLKKSVNDNIRNYKLLLDIYRDKPIYTVNIKKYEDLLIDFQNIQQILIKKQIKID